MFNKSDYEKFYYFFATPYRRMCVYMKEYDDISWEDKCKIFRGGYDYRFEEFFQRKIGGSKPCDFMTAGAPSFCVVSDKVINAFKKNGITGWEAYPVLIHSKKYGDLTNYYAFYVTGVAEKADLNLCEIVDVIHPSGKPGKEGRGYYFPLDSWDGSDIFYHRGTLHITVTERVKKLLESIRATNCNFKSATEFSLPDWVIERDLAKQAKAEAEKNDVEQAKADQAEVEQVNVEQTNTIQETEKKRTPFWRRRKRDK